MGLTKRSLKNLESCHPDLKRIAEALAEEMDIEVICGHRDEAAQNKAFEEGTSKLRWPNSKHNSLPSLAMDVCPRPIDWSKRALFLDMRERIRRISLDLDITVRFISWDLPHVELVV